MTPRRSATGFAIVLATDFLPPARRAYEYAVCLARALRGRLTVMHVVKAAWPAGELEPGGRSLHHRKTAALLHLGRLARLASEAGVRVETRLALGNPADHILAACLQAPPDVLVVGTNGRTGWDRLQLGRSAETLIRRSPSPVLTVRWMIPGDPGHNPRRLSIRHLLVATDFSAAARAALRSARELALRLSADVTLVHAAPAVAPHTLGRGVDEASGRSPARARTASARLNRLVAALAAEGIVARASCVQGEPVEAILREAARCQADVIVAGTGRRSLSRALLGSVAEELVRRAACPVLTVKPASVGRTRRGGA